MRHREPVGSDTPIAPPRHGPRLPIPADSIPRCPVKRVPGRVHLTMRPFVCGAVLENESHTGWGESRNGQPCLTFVPGQGWAVQGGFVRAGGEKEVTYVGIPLGAALFKTEDNPGGADCPSLTASTTGIARTELARATLSQLP